MPQNGSLSPATLATSVTDPEVTIRAPRARVVLPKVVCSVITPCQWGTLDAYAHPDFPSQLANPANYAGFALSHRLYD
jgi:hypothetical protein